jgi:serine/threonine protein phosphatase PrpC
MNLFSAGLSLVGRRANNEDALCDAPALGLFAVADGLGGYEGGEVAAQLTVSRLREVVEASQVAPRSAWPPEELEYLSSEESLLAAATAAAHRAILAWQRGPLHQMGSTVVAALAAGARLTVAHVGDSRCYRLRAGVLELLTRDHSLFTELVQAGFTGDRKTCPFKHQVTRALGFPTSAQPDVATFYLAPGDAYLLCSDGLYDALDDARLADGLRLPPVEACRDLALAAFEAGSRDNITGVVFRCD